MKKFLITFILSVAIVAFVWAQAKKPTPKPQPKKTVVVVKSAPQDMAAAMVRGKAVYNKLCIACHQKDGGGVPRLNPPIIKTDYILGDKKRLIKIVIKGMNQPIEIEDEEYTNPMPAQPQLSDQQVADVLTYARNSFGNKASAITIAEVKAVRASK